MGTPSAAQAESFFREVLERESVWTIRDEGGIPAPENAGGVRAMPFWSLRSRAQKIIDTVPAYAEFAPQEIPLDVFRDRWLTGLARDGLHLGINWSGARATGYDLTPAEATARLDAEPPTEGQR